MPPRPPSQMTGAEFVAAFGAVFEHSPWIAAATFERGLSPAQDRVAGLHQALCRTLRYADHERQLALFRAHPDLAGKLAIAGGLSEASRGEQAGAGLDRCSPGEFGKFSRLNAEYGDRFGFPFILAVRGSGRAAILAALEARLKNDLATEFEAALEQIERIALFRLEDIYKDAGE